MMSEWAIASRVAVLIRWKYWRNFRNSKKVKQLAERIMTHERVVWQENEDFSKTIIYFLARAFQRLQSIEVLCKKGFATDAIALSRALFEDLVNLKYMHKNKARVKDFVDYDRYERFYLGKILLAGDKPIDRPRMEKRQVELEKEWEEVKDRFTKNGRPYTRWSGKSLEAMCEGDQELSDQHFFAYQYFSKYVHPSLLNANDYILGKDGDTVVTQIGTADRLVPEVLDTSCHFFLQILDVVNDEYSIGLDAQLKSISNAIASLKLKRSERNSPKNSDSQKA